MRERYITDLFKHAVTDKTIPAATRAEKHIEKFNSINPYIDSAEGLFCLESVPLYNDFIQISSCYESRSGETYRAWKTLPRSVLTVRTRKGHKGGVFAVRQIPKGVRIGPIEKTTTTKLKKNCYAWKTVNKRVYVNSRLTFSNWTIFVNYTSNKETQNLTISQYDGSLYFRVVEDIDVDEELLVNYDNILTLKTNKNEEMCVPYIEKTFGSTYMCHFCNLRFKYKHILLSHVCNKPNQIPVTELWICVNCNLFICERQYKDFHLELCCKNVPLVKSEINDKRQEVDEDGNCDQLKLLNEDGKIQMTPDKKYYKCRYCCFKAITVNMIYEHTKHHKKWKVFNKENGSIEFYVCKCCKRSIVSPLHLEKHYAKHVAELPFACHFCYYRCFLKDEMKTHLKTEHVYGWINDADKQKEIQMSLNSTRKDNIESNNSEADAFKCDSNVAEDHIGNQRNACIFITTEMEQDNNLNSTRKDNIESNNSEADAFKCDSNVVEIRIRDQRNVSNSITNTTTEMDKDSNLNFEAFKKDGNTTKFADTNFVEKLNSVNSYMATAGGLYYIESDSSYNDFIHISSNYKYNAITSYKPWKMLPRSVLAIKVPENHKGGVFTVRPIPRGVRIGPIQGVHNEKLKECPLWKLDNGKLLYLPRLAYSHWARFVNYTQNKHEQNLTLTQHEGLLYFRTIKNIDINQELLMHHHSILAIVKLRGQDYCVPYIETLSWPIHTCNRCNLGFKSEALLNNHVCNEPDEISISELWICSTCSSFVCEKIYKENHLKNCQPESAEPFTKDGNITKFNRIETSFIKKLNSVNSYMATAGGLYYIESDPSYNDFIHISSNYKYSLITRYKPWKMLPRSVLAIKAPENHKGGVFTIKPIPRGVRIGPIQGVQNEKLKECSSWKLDNGKLLYLPRLAYSHWARFVNYTQNKHEQNLTITQHDGLLYFRTIKNIGINQELLMHHHGILTMMKLRGQDYCVPYIETLCWPIHTCNRCNLGFKSETLLNNHVCNEPDEIPLSELWICSTCNEFVCEKIYQENHLKNCQPERSQTSIGIKPYPFMNFFINSRKIDTTFIHMSSNDTPLGSFHRPEKTLPPHILEFEDGIKALIKLRKGLTMGPYKGLIREKFSGKYGFLFQDGNLVKLKDSNQLNWLSCVNVTSSLNKMNLATLQYNGDLYFEIIKDIEVGHELIVFLNSEIQKFNGITYYIPRIQQEAAFQYLCTCRLGFKTEESLVIHVLTCDTSKYNLTEKCEYCDVFSSVDPERLAIHEKQCSISIVLDVLSRHTSS